MGVGKPRAASPRKRAGGSLAALGVGGGGVQSGQTLDTFWRGASKMFLLTGWGDRRQEGPCSSAMTLFTEWQKA